MIRGVDKRVSFINLSGVMESEMSITEKYSLNRVLMTVDAVGGVWTYSCELARQFKEKNIQVVFVLMGPRLDDAQKKMLSDLDNVEIIESKYKLEWMDDPWNHIDEAGEWLLELEILFHPDIVHLNGFAHAAMAWHAPVLVVAHSCVCSWYDNVLNSQIPVSMKEYKKRVSEGLRCAECVVAPSNAMLQSLYKHYGQIAPSTVIYNGNRKKSTVTSLKETFVLTCGRIWDDAKNIVAIANLASELQWSVYAAGEGDLEGRDYDNFKILGKLAPPALAALMVKAPIFALPSKYEPFGLSILEAASSGCALVLGDIPSLREIWQDAALFVNPNDRVEIRDTIQECIRKPSLRNEYAKRARKRSENFNSETMAENYLRVYQAMMAHKSNIDFGNMLNLLP